MLAAIESRLAAIVGDGLATRSHTAVIRPPGSGELAEGAGMVIVSLVEAAADAAFEIGKKAVIQSGAGPRGRRVVPVSFRAAVDVSVRPEGDDDPGTARTLALDDLALVLHLLDASDVRNGKAFASDAQDPGYEVHAFSFDKASFMRDLAAGAVSCRLDYSGRGSIWPPGVTGPEGEIRIVDTLLASLPVAMGVRDPIVSAGGTTEVRVLTKAATRLIAGGTRGPIRLAVSVASDLPLAERGIITSGVPGPETGLRLVDAVNPETVMSYQAPATVGTPVEFVAVHLATPDGRRGLFLGSAAIRLRGET